MSRRSLAILALGVTLVVVVGKWVGADYARESFCGFQERGTQPIVLVWGGRTAVLIG